MINPVACDLGDLRGKVDSELVGMSHKLQLIIPVCIIRDLDQTVVRALDRSSMKRVKT